MASMTTIQVSGRKPKLTPLVQSFCQSLPQLPPFTGTNDLSHTDPILFGPRADLSLEEQYGIRSTSEPDSEMGYEFTFVDRPLDEDLICVICSLVCRDAVETSCSHIFCHTCLHRWLRQKPECVTCRSPLSPKDIHASGFIRRKILGMKVQCVNEVGCDWTGELRYMSAHLRKECPIQKLIHSTQTFIEQQPTREPEKSSAVAAAVSLAFPPGVIGALPLSALYRLVSFHTYHLLADDESHPAFTLNTSCVMTQYRAANPSAGGAVFAGHPHFECSPGCIKPPTIEQHINDSPHSSSSSERDNAEEVYSTTEYFYSTLVARRTQYETYYRRLASYFHSTPVKILQSFLASKGVEDRILRNALEKVDLIDLCMQYRSTPDSDDYRRQHGIAPLKSKLGKDGRPIRDDPLRDLLGMDEEDVQQIHQDRSQFNAALLMNQLHAAALQSHGFGGAGGAHAGLHASLHGGAGHAAQHFQQHALHTAQHMGLGHVDINSLSLGLGNGVVLSMRVGGGGGSQPSPSSASDSAADPSAMFAQAMAQHHRAHLNNTAASASSSPLFRSADSFSYASGDYNRSVELQAQRAGERIRQLLDERQAAGGGSFNEEEQKWLGHEQANVLPRSPQPYRHRSLGQQRESSGIDLDMGHSRASRRGERPGRGGGSSATSANSASNPPAMENEPTPPKACCLIM